MPLKMKGHDHALPWHLGGEGLIYSSSGAGPFAQKTLSPQSHRIGIDGVQPLCSQLCSFLFSLECGSRCGCCVCDFFPLPSLQLTCRLVLLGIGLVREVSQVRS